MTYILYIWSNFACFTLYLVFLFCFLDFCCHCCCCSGCYLSCANSQSSLGFTKNPFLLLILFQLCSNCVIDFDLIFNVIRSFKSFRFLLSRWVKDLYTVGLLVGNWKLLLRLRLMPSRGDSGSLSSICWRHRRGFSKCISQCRIMYLNTSTGSLPWIPRRLLLIARSISTNAWKSKDARPFSQAEYRLLMLINRISMAAKV